MQIFVISLKRSVERRKFISEQFNRLGLEFSFFDAYCGTDYYDNPDYYDDKKSKRINHRALKAGEVGCALSHNAVYNLIAQNNIPCALICEDDAILTDDLPDVLDLLETELVNKNCVVNLHRCDFFYKKTKVTINDKYSMAKPKLLKAGSCACAVGYIVTYQAALNIQNINKPVFFPADCWFPYKSKTEFWGICPTLTLIKQSHAFETTAQRDVNIGEELPQKDFSKTEDSTPFTLFELLSWELKTYVPITNHIYRFARYVYRHTLKPLLLRKH